MGDLGFLDAAALGQEHIFQQTILHRRTRQEAGVCVDGVFRIVKIEGRSSSRQVEVGFVEGADGPDIAPISVKIIAINGRIFNGIRDDISTEIIKTGVIGQQIYQGFCFEKIDAH